MKKTVALAISLLLYFLPASAQDGISEKFARSFIDRFADPEMIHNVGSHSTVDWQAGYDMFALEHIWKWSGDERYYNYVKKYVDGHVDEEGNVSGFTPTALDHFIPGYVCLMMYEQTGERKYALAAEKFRDGLRDYPRTGKNMFIHGTRMPQVWVDGVFMGQMFLVRYAKTMNHPEDYQEVVRQIVGAYELCGRKDGLFVHAWADKGQGRWRGDGQSPEVWSEGLGWIAVLLADVFDWMPEDVQGYNDIKNIAVWLCGGLAEFQDRRTGLWCQVVDKPDTPKNWNETSGSAMFTYFIQRCIERGFVSAKDFQPVVDKAYEGLKTKCIRNTDGFYNLIDCSSIGVKASYDEYVSQPHEISTFASMGSFMLATGMVENHRKHSFLSPLEYFYFTDYSGGKICRYEKGKVVWEHPAPLSNDLWVLDNGNVLFTTGDGVLELNEKGDTVFSYSSASKIFACQRLKSGNTFIGECSSGRLIEVNPKGKTVKSLKIVMRGDEMGDGYIRNARSLGDGHYLVAHYSGKEAVEYNTRGDIVWQVDVPGGAHSVARMPNGHTLVSSADKDRNPKLVEFDSDGNELWSFSNADVEGSPLKFLSGFQYLPDDDSFVITNWQGHNVSQKGPVILWVGRDKTIRGVVESIPGIETVSSVFIPGVDRIVH